MRKAMLVTMLTAAWTCSAAAGGLDMSKFVGMWEVDYARTLEESKKSPKYNDEMARHMPNIIRRMMTIMKIRLTEKDMIYARGTKEMSLPYSVKASDEESVTVTVKQGQAEATVVFRLIDGKHMNFKSSASDDMHYYIWKKSEAKPPATSAPRP